MRKYVAVFGRDRLTARQYDMLGKFFGGEIEVVYFLGEVGASRVDTLCSTERLSECVEHSIPVDAAVLQRHDPELVRKLLARGIRTYLFITLRSHDGTGDLFDGRVVTVGLGEYGFVPALVRRFYVELGAGR